MTSNYSVSDKSHLMCKKNKKMKNPILLTVLIFFTLFSCTSDSDKGTIKTELSADLCVYRATGAGINAAVAAAREGYSSIIVESTHKIGGLLSSGFRMSQDVPYADHLGGLTGEFYRKDTCQPQPRHHQGASKYNIAFLQEMIDTYPDLIEVITDHRLASVKKENGIIQEAIFEYAPPDENGVPLPESALDDLTSIKAKMFVDASYEGDLMAFSGVSYRVGKESREEYGEPLAGVIISKKFPGIDPYVKEGNPESGLLSCISSDPVGEEGDSSRYFISYNFKLAWEENPTEEYPGIPIEPPKKKNRDVYEMLRRYTSAGYKISWPNDNMARNELMTGAIPGMQVDYPDGNWPTRSRIWQGYIDHVKTLTDFTGKEVRLLSDNNEDTNGWPFLYIRAARRMKGEYIMTQKDLQLQTDPPTPVCLGYYKVDIYPNRIVVLEDGTVAHEGNVWTLVSPGPYQIPYGAIIPGKEECKNLLVPLCMSASHVAYSSIRMEATYMVMGESAGIAAALAIKSNEAIQDIDREELTSMLIKYGQILEWDGKGYRHWRFNFLGEPRIETTRWETNPEEYSVHPVAELWK
jgi:hypothetical protein